MGTAYNMSVEISGHDVGRTEAIKIAAKCEWDFYFWQEDSGTLSASGEGNLYRESDEEFAERLSIAVWRANGRFCNVEIVAGCLADVEYESHSLSENDYLNFANKNENNQMSSALKHSNQIQKLVEAAFVGAPSFEKAVEVWAETADLIYHAKSENLDAGTTAGWIEKGVKLGEIAMESRRPIFEVHVARSTNWPNDEARFYFCEYEDRIVENLIYARRASAPPATTNAASLSLSTKRRPRARHPSAT